MLSNWFRRMNLQTKFILLFLFLLVIVLCSFLAYVHWFVIQPLKESSENEQKLITHTISNQIDEYIASQNQMSQRILSNKQVFQVLSLSRVPTTTKEGLRQNRILKNAMFQAIGPTMNILDMIIYDADGQKIAAFLEYADQPNTLDPKLKQMLDSPESRNQSYVLHLTAPEVVTFNRAIIDQNGVRYGYLTIQLDYDYLEQPTRSIASGSIYIVDEEQQIIAGTDREQIGLPNLELIHAKQKAKPGGVYLDESDAYITYLTSDVTGWVTYVITPIEAVLGPVNSVMNISIVIISILMIVLFTYAYLSIKNLLSPIRELSVLISKIQYNNLNIPPNRISHNDELIALHESFRALMRRLQQSIEREKLAVQEEAKARFSALQAQISPHFIHNVLYLISIAAQEGKTQAVTEMCKLLSENLRYIVSAPYHHVSLAEEFAYISNYLSLVKAHFEDDLEWEISADEAAHSVQIPRLAIQPFVENCIEHAFTHTNPPWHIHISFRLFNDNIWAIEIRDNGSGIEQAKIEEILAHIQAVSKRDGSERTDAGDLDKNSKWGNMGIVNSVHRLKLMYHNRLFFNIFNNPADEKGVTVQIIASLTDDFY